MSLLQALQSSPPRLDVHEDMTAAGRNAAHALVFIAYEHEFARIGWDPHGYPTWSPGREVPRHDMAIALVAGPAMQFLLARHNELADSGETNSESEMECAVEIDVWRAWCRGHPELCRAEDLVHYSSWSMVIHDAIELLYKNWTLVILLSWEILEAGADGLTWADCLDTIGGRGSVR